MDLKDNAFNNISDAKALANIVYPVERVVYSSEDARYFVFLYFMVAFLSLAFSCVCWNTGGINFEMQEDAKSVSAMINGNVSRE